MPLQLAETGFYYTGTKESSDAAKCFMCEKDLDGWERNDDPAFARKRQAHTDTSISSFSRN